MLDILSSKWHESIFPFIHLLDVAKVNFCVIILDSGFRIPDSGFRIAVSGFRIPDSGFRIPAFRVAQSTFASKATQTLTVR